jgi:DNA-binding MarR family transcriptional regulator
MSQRMAEEFEALLPRVLRTIYRPLDDPLGELPMAQLRLVRVLDQESMTMTRLASELNTSVGAVTQLVGRLEELGIVEKAVGDEDRRIRTIQLSEEGRCRMERRRLMRIEQAEEALAVLNEAEQKSLMELLERIVRSSLSKRSANETKEATAALEPRSKVR